MASKRINTYYQRKFSRPQGDYEGVGHVITCEGDVGRHGNLVGSNSFRCDLDKFLNRGETSSIRTKHTVERLRR